MAMAMAMMRSGLRTALRGGVRASQAQQKRNFSASANPEEEIREAAKWEKIAYAGIVTCTVLTIYNLSKGHPHHEEPPAYSYLHIRNKEFPWGLESYKKLVQVDTDDARKDLSFGQPMHENTAILEHRSGWPI
ncbi:hypothetical protein RJ641_011497 [Dillenia turbinata]|uniref:Uncharacterized protein n=1 Tax=Dillenia turbinata TaxID=194707 RepID=A0AAN8Z7A8_9MAGN